MNSVEGQRVMPHGGYECDTQILHTQASAGNAIAMYPAGTGQSLPITRLLGHLSHFKFLAAEKELANAAIAPLVRQLPLDQELKDLLAKYGWHPVCGFSTTLDLAGLKHALQKYKYVKMGQLGSGSYGVVHKAINRETKELLAIKKVAHLAEHGLSESTIREISMLRELHHDNIVRLKDIIATVNGTHVHLVLEFLDCNLRQYLDTYPEASQIGTIKSIILQILRGICHCHFNSIMHRDLKPQNVLVLVARQQVKITDFGLARCFLPNADRAYTEQVVTLYYRAPELLLGAPCYTAAVDLWSLGCIMAEMVNLEPLFRANTEISLLFRIFFKLGTPTADIWRDLPGLAHFSGREFPKFPPKPMQELVPRLAEDAVGLDLLSRLLTYDPSLRITARQALEHPWFDGVVV